MFTTDSLIAELNSASIALDEAQNRITARRNTIIGKFRPVRSWLDSRQADLDVQRLRVDGATQYMLNRKS